MPDIRIALAQVNVTVGDLKANAAKIKSYIQKAAKESADIIVFPEMSVCGYPPEDLVFKPHFIKDNKTILRDIVRFTKGLEAAVIVGFADGGFKDKVYNAAAVICQGRLNAVYHKICLPNYGVFDEKRYFYPGRPGPVFIYKNTPFIITVCEDIWSGQEFKYQVKNNHPALIINISASPYHRNKLALRQSLLKKRAVANKTAVCYCNLVGGQDELVFDGGSLVVSPAGKILAQGLQFHEDLVLADVRIKASRPLTGNKNSQVISLRSARKELAKTVSKTKLPLRKKQPLTSLEEIYQALVLGTHDYVRKNRFGKTAIGLSGGVDSALTAVIAVDALGKESVVGVAMPSRYTSEKTRRDTLNLVKNLEIKLITLPINKIFDQYLRSLKKEFQKVTVDTTEENLQARIRGTLLMALSNKFGWLVLTTGNKSEMGVGYCTLYGDMAGGFAVIKDVPKTLVYELARYRNGQAAENLIPQSIIRRPPTAELKPNQKDQDSLPPYDKLDGILEAYVERHKGLDEIVRQGYSRNMVKEVITMIDKSEYKRRQSPPGVKITPLAFGKDRRFPIVNRYQVR